MSKIIHLLPEVPRYFKTQLHTHSNVSDGKFAPEEVKKLYKDRGYSVVAFTDHNVMAWHRELDDAEFLTLAGGEFNVDHADDRYAGNNDRTYHLNFIAPDPAVLWQPYDIENSKETRAPWLAKVEKGAMPRIYEIGAVNAIIAEAVKRGYLVTYNHPMWSRQVWTDYAPLEGLWAMEIFNTGSDIMGMDEDNANRYHELVRAGRRLFPVAADDMHSTRQLDGGWCMVGAQQLSYAAVFQALKRGDFYASTGPEIGSLTVEGGVLRVACSEAAEVRLQTDTRFARRVLAEEGSELSGAEFDLGPWLEKVPLLPDAFLRVTVIDGRGRYAATRAYRPEEFEDQR